MVRCKKEIEKGQRCIVPVNPKGEHIDGNPQHYNGPSHYGRDGGTFIRG